MTDTSDDNMIAQRNLALLIDGDNAQPSMIEKILREAEKHGSITIRRIYGDWTKPNMNSWKEVLHVNAIQPVQQFRYTVGKNATDSALIIDAMDILHAGLVEGFCIVSSDSDYTRLATRLREKGLFVMGIGEKKTPQAFVKACNLFVYTENLKKTDVHVELRPKAVKAKEIEKVEVSPLPLLIEAFEMAVQEDGWAHLATLGNSLRKIDPGFDPRTYGYKQLSQLIKAFPDRFEVRHKDDRGPTAVYVRLKDL